MKNLMSDMSQQRINIKFHSSVIYDSIIPLINVILGKMQTILFYILG